MLTEIALRTLQMAKEARSCDSEHMDALIDTIMMDDMYIIELLLKTCDLEALDNFAKTLAKEEGVNIEEMRAMLAAECVDDDDDEDEDEDAFSENDLEDDDDESED